MNSAVLAFTLALLPGLAVGGQDVAAPPKTASPAAPVASGAASVIEALVETAEGTFVIRLLPALAPAHVKHFVANAQKGGFDGTTFHRIVPGGMIQGGDPLSKDPLLTARYGTGGLGLLKAEFSDRPFTRGVVAAARKASSPDSGGSQFFVCIVDQPALKGQYTLFGEVVSGMEVVDTIGQTPVEVDRPKSRVEIQKVTIRTPSPAPAF